MAISTVKRYKGDDASVHAAALTYYMFFSIFPVMIFVASVLGYITFLSNQFRQDLVSSGLRAFPLLDSLLSEYAIDVMQRKRGSLALIGLILALYAGSGGVHALKRALTKINRLEARRGFVRGRLASLTWLVALGLTVVGSLILGSVASFASRLFESDSFFFQAGVFVLGHLVGAAAGFLIFATAFKFLPPGRRSWREVATGAAFAAIMFEVVKVFGAWFLKQTSASREASFGAFSTAAALLVAAFLIAQIILVAAELNAVISERHSAKQ